MKIKTVTVIGANGTMGTNISGIFASFGNAKVYMISRDINESRKALIKVGKSVKAESIIKNLVPADFSMLSQCVEESDVVFESTAEKYNVKMEVNSKISMAVRDDTIVCSGTSGLSLTKLVTCFPEKIRRNYFGMHMFNPPYNMSLCELIPTKYSDLKKMKELKDYLETVLLSTVVEVKDMFLL